MSIRTEPDGHFDSVAMSSAGLHLRDGRRLPTYDWLPESRVTFAQER